MWSSYIHEIDICSSGENVSVIGLMNGICIDAILGVTVATIAGVYIRAIVATYIEATSYQHKGDMLCMYWIDIQ